jgi:hypothetical protein
MVPEADASDVVAQTDVGPDVSGELEDALSPRDAARDQAGEVSASVVPPCPVLPVACDPVGNVLCPSPVLNCYLTDVAATVCTCPTGAGDEDAPCKIYSDCMPGLACVGDVSGTGRCHATCYVSSSNCPIAGTSCLPITAGTKLGYCG